MRTGGEKTRKKILDAAERLFSEKGFDGTSVSMIADAVGINKGLIYYHFKNKNDIIVSLFTNTIDELLEYMSHGVDEPNSRRQSIDLKEKIRQEITFLESKKRILSVMLMEAFKNEDRDNFLLRCAEIHIKQENEYLNEIGVPGMSKTPADYEHFVYEFFTGFIPVVTFVAMKDIWCQYFNRDGDELLNIFLDSFEKTHLASHRAGPKNGA